MSIEKTADNAVESILSEHAPNDFHGMDQMHGEFFDYAMERIWRYMHARNHN